MGWIQLGNVYYVLFTVQYNTVHIVQYYGDHGHGWYNIRCIRLYAILSDLSYPAVA